jgi:hypothetical protein
MEFWRNRARSKIKIASARPRLAWPNANGCALGGVGDEPACRRRSGLALARFRGGDLDVVLAGLGLDDVDVDRGRPRRRAELKVISRDPFRVVLGAEDEEGHGHRDAERREQENSDLVPRRRHAAAQLVLRGETQAALARNPEPLRHDRRRHQLRLVQVARDELDVALGERPDERHPVDDEFLLDSKTPLRSKIL